MTSIHSLSISIEQPQQSSNRYSQPPPYLTSDSATIEQQQPQREQEHRQRRRHKKKRALCSICQHHDPPTTTRKQLSKYNTSALAMMGPYLVHHHDRIYWITTCYCDKNKVHASCLSMILLTKTTLDTTEHGYKQRQQQLRKDAHALLTCASCHYSYRTGWRLGWVRLMVCCVHLLSLASVIGLVYGLSFLGRSLDELGLGNEMGAKLDGDENWQDHEMQEIADWLNLVHLVTALAGEALLGLVYVVGVCGVIGPSRTVQMIYAILYLDLAPIFFTNHKGGNDSGGSDNNGDDYPPSGTPSTISTWCHYFFLWFGLSWFGLIFGTWLLFYSWVWACLFHFLCRRILNVRKPTIPSSLPSPSSP